MHRRVVPWRVLNQSQGLGISSRIHHVTNTSSSKGTTRKDLQCSWFLAYLYQHHATAGISFQAIILNNSHQNLLD